MTHKLAALIAVLDLSSIARGQDMPLSQILIDGEGWGKVEGVTVKPKAVDPLVALGEVTWDGQSPSTAMRSVDGETLYVGFEVGRAVWVYPAPRSAELIAGAPYCPLRLAQKKRGITVTGLLTDRDGRIYAATELGVQVFDPSGRLCGVLTPAAKGRPEHMAFEGDQLTMWVGSTKYARKLNARGVN
jgi:sugar lactone lactonase YvrE